jgi:SAM-dependent methyltransferase
MPGGAPIIMTDIPPPDRRRDIAAAENATLAGSHRPLQSSVMTFKTPGLNDSYDTYPRIEEEFQSMLDESLHPRGPDVLYDIVASLGLPRGSRALDLGCGEGGYTIQLAHRVGFTMLGIDPVLRPPTGERHIELVREAFAGASALPDELRARVYFAQGSAEALPIAGGVFDLIWSREMVLLVRDLDAMFAECRRVLRDGGYLLVESTFATDRPSRWRLLAS